MLLAVGASAVAAATALVLAWPFHGSPSVLAQAAAAIGDREVTHVVTEYEVGGSLVDLRTGKRTPVSGRSELWYDPKRGLLQIISFRGQPIGRFFERPSTVRSASWLQTFVTGYKAALRSGAFRVTGSGVVDGTPVYWIESKPSWDVWFPFGGSTVHKQVEEVAIAKTTYRPVFTRLEVDGRTVPGLSSRILTIETVAPKPGLFAPGQVSSHSGAGFNGWSPQTTLAQARAAMHRPALVPATTIAGVQRNWIGEPGYLSGFQSYKDQIVGVELYYGKLDPANYGPPYNPPFMSITEFPRRNPFVAEQGLGYFPGNDQAVLEGNTATLKTHGFYVIINASDATHALAAAKALIDR